MVNFTFHTPTRVLFGKDAHKDVGRIIKEYGFQKTLLHYGGGSIKKTGLYGEVVASLKASGISYCELGGVEPNPKLSFVHKGMELCKKEGVDFILAVGGGSVIDSSKAIALGAANGCDPWRFTMHEAEPEKVLPVGVVLTISAAGSEMSNSVVITNEALGLKRGLNHELNRPLFALCNPELTYSVSPYQTSCGTVDIMMHTLERYFSRTPDTDLIDRMAEGLLKAVIAAGAKAYTEPNDYEARATLMWASSLSHNGLTGTGREFSFANHGIEHDISGVCDFVSHGAGLAVVWPAWAKYVYKTAVDLFCRYAVRVWNCEMDVKNPENTALEGILKTEQYFKSIGMPVRLHELGVGEEKIGLIAEKVSNGGTKTIPSLIPLGKKEVLEILTLANKNS